MNFIRTILLSCFLLAMGTLAYGQAGSMEQYFQDGLQVASEGNMELAVTLFSKAIAIQPHETLYFNRGTCKLRLEDYFGAIQDFNNAIDLNPEDSGFFLNRGNAKHKVEDYRGAVLDFNQAVRLNERNYKAYFSRGQSKNEVGDKKAAMRDFDKSIEINPKYDKAYLFRGILKNEQNDSEGACADWQKAGELGDLQGFEMIKIYCD